MIPARDLRKHAKAARVLAEQINDPDLRLKMLGIAGDLDRYAARKEAAERKEESRRVSS
jgi:hypothetical protein